MFYKQKIFIFKISLLFLFFSLSLPALAQSTPQTPAPQTGDQEIIQPRLNINIPGVQLSQGAQAGGLLNLPFLADYISGLYKYLIAIAGILAGIMLTVGGVQYLMAAGNKSAIDAALKRIKNALFGLILALGSYIILFTINPKLVTFEAISLQTIPASQLALVLEGNSNDSESSTAISGGTIPADSNEYKQFAKNVAQSMGINACFFIGQITMESRWNPSVGTGCCHGLGQISVTNARTLLSNSIGTIRRMHPEGCPNCPAPNASKETIVSWLKTDWKSNLIMSAILKKTLSSTVRNPMSVIGSYGYGLGTQNDYIRRGPCTPVHRTEDEVAEQIRSGQTNQIIQEACIVPDTWPLAKASASCPGGKLCCRPGSSPCARPDASPQGRVGACQDGSNPGKRCIAGAGTQSYIRSFINTVKRCLQE